MKWILIGVVMASAAAAHQACLPCHARQVKDYLETGMGRSMSRASADWRWEGRIGATRFRVAGPRQSIERNRLQATHDAEFAIGSGNHAVGFLVRNGDYLFQSPLSWYARRRTWDIAPGYESSTHPDFNRPIVAECLFCHANRAAPAADTMNRYPGAVAIGEPISCERCHGSAEKHLRQPSASTIVNPSRLPPRRRDAVCEQCHLGGEARILNPGRAWHDWTPGQVLEDTFTVYAGSPPGEFKVVSHVEQLAQSRCATESQGRLWCGTCHDPHAKPRDVRSHYRSRCLSCHTETTHPAGVATGDCAGCHMPRRRAPDSGHAAFTDHFIRRAPHAEPSASEPRELTAWREPPAAVARRNLGLAYAHAGEKRQSVTLLGQAGRILSEIDVEHADAETLAALGLVRLLQDRPKDAVLLFERAVAARPAWAAHYHKLALAWKAAGDPKRAAAVLRRGIEIDPSMEALYHSLADLESGSARREALERYLRFAPKSLVTREALSVHLRQ